METEYRTRSTTADKTSLSFTLILSAFMAFTSLSTDIYLPAMPAMQKDLGGHAELTVTGFLLGFAIAQLVWGPISDHLGRKMPLFIGTVLFIIGSVGCATATSMEMVVFWRVLQAIGACTGPMISRAMIRDRYDGNRAAQVLSTLMLIMAAAPIIGPLTGGSLISLGSWRIIFWLMVVIGVLLFLSARALPETLPAPQRSTEAYKYSFRNYFQLLTSRSFMVYTLSVTFFYIGAYAFISGSSTIYIDHFHVSPEHYSLLFGLNIVGVSILSMINRQLVAKYQLKTLLAVSTTVAFLFSIVLVIAGVTGAFGLWGIVVPMFFVFSMNGIIAACSNAAALNSVPNHLTGSASALLGSLQYGSGIIPSILLAVFADSTPKTMTVIITTSLFFAALMGLLGRYSKLS
ncbi:multidrug effflux MFS transporter [Alloscardovia criceti]|uniref:multidrug effflux MFS transporter n=1 Tax=Alloscardovia criceti TaxID=356828 RepID=UPI0003608885|nr:multidrug effflux MFS transporter [Alloscardovia criceti]